MFDERHLQLTSAYARASQHFIRAFIYPLGEFIYKSIESAIDLKCRIEIGEETYFLTPDEDGGWKWSKNNFEGVTDEEIEQVEEIMAYLLPKLLPGSNDITPSNFPPEPDLPPVLPNPNSPLILPPSATSVEFLTIPFDSQNPQEYLPIQDQENLGLNASIQRNVFFTVESANNGISSKKLELQNTQHIPPHPEHIDPQHWHELVVGSAIAPEIAHLNFSSLHFSYVGGEHEAWERLMISDKLSRTNTGSLSIRLLELYSHLDAGGWWCNSGVDPRTFANLPPGEQPQIKEWGCYKPNRPRPKTVKKDGFTVAVEGKFIKYEHPPSVDLSIFLLDVPGVIAQNIYSKAGVNPTDSDRLSCFWYCVYKHYRIIFRQTTDNTSTLQLLKTEHNGTNREAVRFQFEKTDTGMTHQVQAMAITEADLEKLRLLAQKLHINYQSLFVKPTDTRDIDLPVHPEITRNLDQKQSYQSTQSAQSTPNVPDRKTQSNSQGASFNSPKQDNAVSHSTTPTPSQPTKQPKFSSNLDNAVLPLHPVLKQYWEQLEKDGSSHETVAQGHLEFQSKIQQTGKLTVGEQRELYQQIQNLAWSEINHNGCTDIVLPPLAHIVNDLRSQVQKEAQLRIYSDPKRDTPVPLHADIASHWHDLETNKTWSSVANQYNNPLREKLSKTGKLTIGEQRELYQKILLQSQFEQQNIGQTNISLPPLSDIIQDLLNTRSQIINNTYTPKVEVHSQKSHTPQQPTTNSQELEL